MTDGQDADGGPIKGDITKLDPKFLQRVFGAVWRTLAPDTPPQEFYDAVGEHIKSSLNRVRLTAHGTRVIGPEEAATLPDNSADYEPVTFAFEGLDEVKALVAERTPVAFVTWHHGARHHADFGIARAFPQTAIFARRTFQYGKVFSIPMEGAPAVGLMKMDRYLREGTPIYFYVDGPPLGNSTELPMLGVMSRFATAPISIIKAVEGVRIIPITNYYRDGNRVDYIFHPPLPAPDRISGMTEHDILTALIGYLEADLRQRAPEQVFWTFLVHREQVVREYEMRKPAVRGRETP